MRGKEDYPCRTEADGGLGAARAMALHAPQDADGGTIGSASPASARDHRARPRQPTVSAGAGTSPGRVRISGEQS